MGDSIDVWAKDRKLSEILELLQWLLSNFQSWLKLTEINIFGFVELDRKNRELLLKR